MEEIKRIVEALLFASSEPLSADRAAAIVPGVGKDEVAQAVRELGEDYAKDGRSFQIVEVAGGYQLTTKAEYAVWVEKLFESTSRAKLSKAALETLAVVAYKQPVLRSVIESVRGVNVDGVLRTLMERNLVRMVGRGEGPGRPLLFGTTRDFLLQFGINKLSDLPKVEEIAELVGGKPDAAPDPGADPGADLGDDPEVGKEPERESGAGPDTEGASEPHAESQAESHAEPEPESDEHADQGEA